MRATVVANNNVPTPTHVKATAAAYLGSSLAASASTHANIIYADGKALIARYNCCLTSCSKSALCERRATSEQTWLRLVYDVFLNRGSDKTRRRDEQLQALNNKYNGSIISMDDATKNTAGHSMDISQALGGHVNIPNTTCYNTTTGSTHNIFGQLCEHAAQGYLWCQPTHCYALTPRMFQGLQPACSDMDEVRQTIVS